MIPQWMHEEVKQERDEANQRCEWVAAALHGDPIFGTGAVDSLVIQVNALRTQRDTARTVTDAMVERAWRRLVDQCGHEWFDDREYTGLINSPDKEDIRAALTAALTQEDA
jgi:hypothetical protein